MWMNIKDIGLIYFIVTQIISGHALLTLSFSYPVCEKAIRADIVFLLDGSNSIGSVSFDEVRFFVSNIIKDLDIGPDNIHIGLAQYSGEPYQEFLLTTHTDKTSLLAAVAKFNYRGGNTKTGKALNFLRTQYFTKEAGSRAEQKVPQIALVITDGSSGDSVAEPARLLKKHGVTVFCIGVGKANQEDLKAIASLPLERFMLTVDSFKALDKLKEHLVEKVCGSVENEGRGEAND